MGDCFSNFKCAFALALLATFRILQPIPFLRLQVGRKTPVFCPTCDLQFMHWNRTIYFSRTFSWNKNARSESEMLPPSPNLLLFFPTLLPPPHWICLLYRCSCHLLTFPATVVTPRQRWQSGGGSAAAVWQWWAVRRRHQQRKGDGGRAVAALEAVVAASSGVVAAVAAERQRRRQHGDGSGRAAAG